MGILTTLGLAGTALGFAPVLGPAIDIATGQRDKKLTEKYLRQGRNPEGDFNVSFLDKQLFDESKLGGMLDERELKKLKDTDYVIKAERLGVAAPTLGMSLADYKKKYGAEISKLARAEEIELGMQLAEAKHNTPQAKEARRIAADERNRVNFQTGLANQHYEQERLDRLSREKIAREESLATRQDNLNLQYAQLAQMDSRAEQNYNLALQKMERDAKLSHQAKMAQIIGGIGSLGMLMAA